MPFDLESAHRESLVIRPDGAAIERVTVPSTSLTVSLREDVPGEVYLLTLTARPGWNEGRQTEPVVTILLQGRDAPIRVPIQEHSSIRASAVA